MGILDTLFGFLASVAAVGAALIGVVSWLRTRRCSPGRIWLPWTQKPKPRQEVPHRNFVSQDNRMRLVPAVRAAYILLRLDQLPAVGNWGFTIDRYIELNYPNDKKILTDKDLYLREGSITHTAHALRGLNFLKVPIPGIGTDLIRRWVEANTVEIGLVQPSLAANPDQIRGLIKEIRHTASATLALLRLRPHIRSQQSREEVDRWVAKRGPLLLEFPHLWERDPRMTYTYAYLLELLEMLNHEQGFARKSGELNAHIDHGLEQLFGLIAIDKPYWCTEAHAESKIFYSLLTLSRVLAISRTYTKSEWVDKAVACLEDIGRTASRIGGVSFGQEDKNSRFGTVDFGSTAAFLECCYHACGFGVPLENMLRHAAGWIDSSVDNLEFTTRNAITHTWESVLSLLNSAGVDDFIDCGSFTEEVEPLLEEVAMQLTEPQHLPIKPLERLGDIAGCREFLRLRFENDVWRSALRRAAIVAKET